MKTLGLIGGLSWFSTTVYYKTINQLINERLGSSHSAKILLYSVDFNDFKTLNFFNRCISLLKNQCNHFQMKERMIFIAIFFIAFGTKTEIVFAAKYPITDSLKIINENKVHLAKQHFSNGDSLYKSGKYHKSNEFYNMAFEHFAYNSSLLGMAECITAIGWNYVMLADYKQAKFFFDSALVFSAKNFHKDHVVFSAILNNMGEVFKFQGEYDSALVYFKLSLSIKQKNYKPDDRHFAITYNNLGIIHKLLGDYETSLIYYQKALLIHFNSKEKNPVQIAKCYGNIALVYKNTNEYQQALEYNNKALELFVQNLGDQHHWVAQIYNNLGTLYADIDEHENEIINYNKAMEIWKQHFNNDHPNISFGYSNLGLTYASMKQFEKAISYLDSAKEISIKSLGANHPATAMIYMNIGNTLVKKICFQKELLKNHSELLEHALTFFQQAIIKLADGYGNEDIYHNPEINKYKIKDKLYLYDALDRKANAFYIKWAISNNSD